MCLILFATRAHANYPLIVAANRDEAYARPAARAAFWSDHPDIFGGRDLEQGGTWLGIARTGRFAAITNYRQRPRAAPAPCSRGEIARNFLCGSGDTPEYLESIAQRQHDYRGYSLIAGTLDQLYFYSNRAERMQPVSSGVHGLSNDLLDEPWPKVQRGIELLGELLEADEQTLTHNLFERLADRTPAADPLLPDTGLGLERERASSAAFIPGASYGTRASTVILVSRTGDVLFCERTFGAHGVLLGEVEQRFELRGSVTASRRAAAGA